MSSRRTYEDGCAAAHALDIVGGRWTLLVVRELLLGPKRFVDLRSGIPGVSPDVLSRRLRDLEIMGVVRRRRMPPPAASRVYEVTDWGMQLEPVLVTLGRWGAASPSKTFDLPLGTDSLILSFRTMFDSNRAEDLSAVYELHFGEDTFRATISDGELDIVRGQATNPDAVVTTDSNTLAGMTYGGLRLEDAVASGAVEIHGDEAAARRFLTLFPLPQAASPDGAIFTSDR